MQVLIYICTFPPVLPIGPILAQLYICMAYNLADQVALIWVSIALAITAPSHMSLWEEITE
jgi:hypothetical protein